MVLFTLADKRKMSNRKAEILRNERLRLGNDPNVENKLRNYNIEAERRAIKNIENLKMAGLLTPTPSPKAAGRTRATKVAAAPAGNIPNVTQSPGGRFRIGRKLCTSYKKPELVTVLKRMGHRVDEKMTIKELCGYLRPRKVASPPKRSPPKKVASPLKKYNASSGTCMDMKRSELVQMAKEHGIKGYSKMTMKEICCALKGQQEPNRAVVVLNTPVKGKISRIAEPLLNVKKMTYKNYKKPELTKLVKALGFKGYSKNTKDQLINRLYTKLNTNMKAVLPKMNRSTVTARHIAEALARNHGWLNNRHVERAKIVALF